MSILARAKQRLESESPHQAARISAFMGGYLGEPMTPEQAADTELRNDWEHGVRQHDKEKVKEEEMYRVHH